MMYYQSAKQNGKVTLRFCDICKKERFSSTGQIKQKLHFSAREMYFTISERGQELSISHQIHLMMLQ